MKILHVYRTYFPDSQGGGEELIRQICLNTTHLGADNRVFTLSRSPASSPIEREEATVFQGKLHLEIASCGISFTAHKLYRELAAWADILHYHYPWPYGDLLHLTNGLQHQKPVVVSYLSDVVRQKLLAKIYQPVMNRFLDKVNRIVATSPNYAASSPILNTRRTQVDVIPIGINHQTVTQANDAKISTIEKCFGNNFVFFVGVLRYYKGLKYLVEAAKDITIPIVIAGTGPEEESLKALAREAKQENIHFIGQVSDKEKMSYMAACRAFIFPSHLPSESFGISLLEAAFSGKPMITCEIGTGTTYVNIHNQTGIVVPPANPAALSAAINLLGNDHTLAKNLGQNARSRYEALFTGEAMGKQYFNLYQHLLSSAALKS